MQAVSFPARQARTHYRHELRTLTYVTLDEGNGGIVRNLNREGVAVQAVAPLRARQRVRLRFELRFPRLRVEAYGEVSWSNSSGQCGIRFVELPARMSHQIDEWIFSNLLDSMARDAAQPRSIFGTPVVSIASADYDGLTLSTPPRPPIRLQPSFTRSVEIPILPQREQDLDHPAYEPRTQLAWLSRPISPRALAWLVDSLVMIAALLLFALIFLSIAHELPQWQLTLSAAVAAAGFVAISYWSIFAVFGGPSVGARLARTASGFEEEHESETVGRFR